MMELFAVLLFVLYGEYADGEESVLLPCHYEGALPDVNPAVIWSRKDLKPQIIHLRREKDDLDGENQDFTGRTSMKSDALDSGDFSLILRKPHFSDSGTYTCSLSDGREELRVTDVQLQVKDQQEEVKVHEREESAVLPCKTAAHLEEDDTVEWTRTEPEFMIIHVYQNGSNKAKEQDQFSCDHTRMNKDQVKSGDLSLILRDPKERDSGLYICTVYRKSDVVRQKVNLQFVNGKSLTWIIIFPVLLVLLILLILLVSGGFVFRQYFMSVYRVEVDSGEESVLLPFKTAVCLPKRVTVTWRHNNSRVVHINDEDIIVLLRHEAYKYRTEMKEKRRDFSLNLRKPTDRDTGTYSCTVCDYYSGKVLTEKQVLLNVKAGPDSLIVAIDFGSGFSGFAFNVKPREEGGETQIKRWSNGLGLDTPKTPTCILFDEHQEFMKFGYEAKTSFTNMSKEEAEKYYFFENFSWWIQYTKRWSEKTCAANYKPKLVLKVFTEVLRFLKDDALNTIKDPEGGKFTASDFTWVLTVPGILKDFPKQFIIKSATQAGLVTEETKSKLMFVLESEAALTWCLKLQPDGFITQNHSRDSQDQPAGTAEPAGAAEPDTSCNDPAGRQEAVQFTVEPEEVKVLLENQRDEKQYLVVDCGDYSHFTVHKVLEGGTIKLHKTCGIYLGDRSVDEKFQEFLREIFSDGVWNEYEKNFPNEVQKMMYDFTRLKQLDEDVQISCSGNLVMLAQKEKQIETFFDSVDGASWDDGSIRISREKLRSFYEESLQEITKKLREILNKNLNIDYIVLVGGFAESQILRQHITDEFGPQYKVLCPLRPQEAILKGAVELGRNPKLVESQRKRPAWFKCLS